MPNGATGRDGLLVGLHVGHDTVVEDEAGEIRALEDTTTAVESPSSRTARIVPCDHSSALWGFSRVDGDDNPADFPRCGAEKGAAGLPPATGYPQVDAAPEITR